MITRNKPPDSRIERQIAIGMITNTPFVREIEQIYRPDFLALPYVKTVVGWCLDYYQRYKEAPGRHIQDIFIAHRQGSLDPAQADLIETFLAGLSDEYEQAETFNVQYVSDKAEKHFRQQALDNLRKQLATSIVGGRIEDGEALVADFNRIVRHQSVGVDPISNTEEVVKALDDTQKGDTLFSMPGDLGRMIGPFERGHLVAILAPMKRGKTWWLQEIALRGLFSGYNVLFVSLEMTKRQMIRRMYHNLCALPSKRWATEGFVIPVFDCKENQYNLCDKISRKCNTGIMDDGDKLIYPVPKQYKPCTACRGEREYKATAWHRVQEFTALDAIKAVKKARALKKTFLRGGRLKLYTPPPNTLSVAQLQTMLDNWEYYEAWVPDVVITDYSDKFAPEDRAIKEYRHRIYQTILAHKALALGRNILVVTAAQSNTGRDDRKDVGAGAWAEDIRKKAEVDIAWSLNQKPEEKQQGIMRILMSAQRHDDFDTVSECMVLQQLKIGKPYLDSYWKR